MNLWKIALLASLIAPAVNATEILVTTWNVEKFKDQKAYPCIQKFAENSDILFIQEALYTDRFMNLVDDLGFNVVQGVSFAGLTSNYIDTGIATITPHDVIRSQTVKTDVLEPVTDTPKLSQYSLIEIAGNEVLAVNVHGINFVSNFSYQKELNKIEERLKSFAGPIIFAGDFNTWNQGRLDALLAMAQRLNLNRVSFQEGSVKQFLGQNLDHVFYRGVDVLKVIHLPKFKVSDHLPLKVVFSL